MTFDRWCAKCFRPQTSARCTCGSTHFEEPHIERLDAGQLDAARRAVMAVIKPPRLVPSGGASRAAAGGTVAVAQSAAVTSDGIPASPDLHARIRAARGVAEPAAVTRRDATRSADEIPAAPDLHERVRATYARQRTAVSR